MPLSDVIWPSKAALGECLASLNLPPGLLSSVYQTYLNCDSRVWLLDNSSRMQVRDSHINRNGCTRGAIERVDGGSRWEELKECVTFHTKMASECWIPTKYWLVNDPFMFHSEEWRQSKKMPLCRGAPKDVATEVREIGHIMDAVQLNDSRCPLRSCIHTLLKGLSREAAKITARNQHVTLVICTQGRPTDREGDTGLNVLKDFCDELFKFSKLPVRIIIRLCTDTEEVRDMFNSMEGHFESIDVLDDFWAESLEVYLHNPWLTYTLGLHRLRESGLAPEILDTLDERPLTLGEIHQLSKMLFLDEDDFVDLPHPRKDRKKFLSRLTSLVKDEKMQWNPVKKKMMPWINLRKLTSMYGGGEHSAYRWREHPTSVQKARHSPGPLRHTDTLTQDPLATAKGNSLMSVIQKWSHGPPYYDKMYSLQRLLVTVPLAFPPINKEVEPHTYFTKWKFIYQETFEEEDGDALRDLLVRAMRKAKYFLDPIKFPKDFNKKQVLLLKTIGNIIRDREEATLG